MATSFYHQTGNVKWREVMRIDSSGNIGIGPISPKSKLTVESYNEWNGILMLAETNPAVKTALERLRTTYYLSRENGNSKEKA
jgi:hypothetical protein